MSTPKSQADWYARKKLDPEWVERHRAKARARYETYKEQMKATALARYHANQEELNERAKEYHRKNPERKQLAKDKSVAKGYGLTLEAYYELKSGTACVICQRSFGEKIKSHIDHCHTTGKVRGLICNNCNHMLGQARDDIEVLERAIEYLKVKR